MKQEFYTTPTIETIEIAVESGFAQSQQVPAPWEDL